MRDYNLNHVEISPGTYIKNDMGVWGDHLNEFLVKYSDRFHVKMNTYTGTFTIAKKDSFGGLFFKSPNEKEKEIPVTNT